MVPVSAVLAGTQIDFTILDPHPGMSLRQNAPDVLIAAIGFHVFAEEHVFCDLQSFFAGGSSEVGIFVVVLELLESGGHIAATFAVQEAPRQFGALLNAAVGQVRIGQDEPSHGLGLRGADVIVNIGDDAGPELLASVGLVVFGLFAGNAVAPFVEPVVVAGVFVQVPEVGAVEIAAVRVDCAACDVQFVILFRAAAVVVAVGDGCVAFFEGEDVLHDLNGRAVFAVAHGTSAIGEGVGLLLALGPV